jgi:two-component system, OmpR family, phosphate regulon sensor histidine kinase PhoR
LLNQLCLFVVHVIFTIEFNIWGVSQNQYYSLNRTYYKIKKNVYWILPVVASVALLGLIVLQYFWIRNAFEVKQEQFSQQVNKSLNEVVEELEKEETIVNIIEEINYYGNTNKFKRDVTIHTNHENQMSVDSSLMKVSNEVARRLIPRDSEGIVLQESKTLSAYDPTNLTKSSIKLRYMQKVTDKSFFVKNVINKLITKEKPIKDRVDPTKLKKIIKDKLDENDIHTDFEFAVFSGTHNIVHKSNHFITPAPFRKNVVQLFPNDVFTSKSFLEVYFPNQADFMFQSIGLMVISSVLLTTILIIIFSVSIAVIFKQKKISEMRSDFVSNMTHELKTPISTISLAAQLLNDSTVDSSEKNYEHLGKIIQDESKRLGYQVEKVLQMARFERGQIKLHLKIVNIEDIIRNVIENFRLVVEKQGGQIEYVNKAENSMVSVDDVHFTNIIVNLLDNATKYCHTTPLIVVSTYSNVLGVYISVKDNGIGISKENQKHIFEQFYRVSTGNIHNVKGFGIGLSYVKSIVDLLHGDISVVSDLNKGAEFIIFLPYRS